MQKNKRGKKQMKEDNRSRDQKVAQLREKISSRIYREKEPRFKLANTIVLWMQLLLEFGMLLNMGYLGVTGNSRVMVGITIAWIVLGRTDRLFCIVFSESEKPYVKPYHDHSVWCGLYAYTFFKRK